MLSSIIFPDTSAWISCSQDHLSRKEQLMEPDILKKGVIRTPDERFTNLPGFDFEPNYLFIDGLRVHYLDEGPRDAPPILLMHGEPSWCYLYRKMIPLLVEEGYRVIAPDLIGFGRSDKFLKQSDYSYQMQVDVMTCLVRELDLLGVTTFVQDWGGLIGLRVVAEEPERFERIIAANTGFPQAPGWQGFIGKYLFRWQVCKEGKVDRQVSWDNITLTRWVAFTRQAKEFPIGEIIQRATVSKLPDDVLAAYDAPFPDDRYKAGARIMPSLIPTQLTVNHRAWEQVFRKWQKPFLTAFSDSDPITRKGELVFKRYVPGAKGQPHATILGAGHFLQEDKGEVLAKVTLEFIEGTS